MAHILNYIYVGAAVIFLFGAAIFIHEFGHYWVARRRGLKVEAFAIGFGPKIFGWTRNGIEYSWRLIPAGGYVKLPQMVTSQQLEGAATDPGEKIPPASPFSKILVALAGPAMNVLFAIAIACVIYLVGLPVAVNPSIIGYVDPKSAEAKLGIREGDRIVQINGKVVKSWQDVQLETMTARTNVLPVMIEREGVRTTYQLKTIVNEVIGMKMLDLDPKDHPVIVEVKPGMVADKAGLKVNDTFLSFSGVPIVGQDQLTGLIQKRPGQPSELEVQRGQEKIKMTVTPQLDTATQRGLLGVMLSPSTVTVYQVQKPGPTPKEQITGVLEMMRKTFSALFHHKETGIGAKDLSGPVGILSSLAIQVNTDYRLALSFMVLLNINLAILNLLPIPVLDGGHILMSIYEAVTRRKISVRFVEYTTTAFAILLISFMLYVSFFDLRRLPLFRMMLKRQTHVEQTQPSSDPAATNPAP
ncbi:MAG: RIP metalloprotease RseP [Verrucomicrobiota bacterium]